MKKIIILILILISCSALAEYHFTYKKISTDEGLSGSTVNTIIQDKNGFIWVGTLNGLNKYDGYTFKKYNYKRDNQNTISGNRVYSLLYQPQKNLIWIGLFDGGLNSLNTLTGEIKRFDLKFNKKNSSGIHIRNIINDTKGYIWISTNGSGLKRYDIQNKTFKTFKHNKNDKNSLASNYVRMVYEDLKGTLWIATKGNGKLISYDYSNENFKEAPFKIKGKNIEWITGNKNILFIGTRDGALNIVNTKTRKIEYIYFRKENGKIQKTSLIRVLFFEKNSSLLWIGTEKGLYIYDTVKKDFLTIKGLGNMHIRTVFKDNTGLIWLGTLSNGLIKINKNSLPVKYLLHQKNNPASLVDDVVWSIFEDKKNNFWVSTTNGLTVFDKDYNFIKSYTHNDEDEFSMSESNATSFLEFGESKILIGTYGDGLEIFDKNDEKFININKYSSGKKGLNSNYISKLFKENDTKIWVATYDGGLSIFNPENKTFSTVKNIKNKQIRDIIKDSNDNIWIATYGNGLFKYKNGKFKNYLKKFKNKALTIDNSIYSIAYDKFNNYIWAASEGGYLLFDINKEKFIEYKYLNQLNNKVLIGVIGDYYGNIWFSSAKGIYWVKQKEKKVFLFDKKDGLLKDEFNENAYYLKKDGTVCFGSKKGVVLLKPENIKITNKKPKISLTSVKIDGQEYSKNIYNLKNLKISYDNYLITFNFSIIDYLDPSKNTYQYKIKGINNHWSEFSRNNQLIFTSLKPGKYELMIRGKNSRQILSENTIKINIEVIPPFYYKKSFIFTISFLILLTIFTIIKIRMNSIKKANKILESKVKEKTKELYETNQKLREMALTDSLTGLRNRHFFKAVLKEEINHFINDKIFALNNPKRKGDDEKDTVMGLFMVDLDHFKLVNDKYGHDSGDMVLKELAQIFKDTTRGSDSVIRWGGEEFLIILKNCDINYLDTYCKKLITEIKNHDFKVLNGEKTIKKTCSVGYVGFPSVLDKPDYINLEQAIIISDLALYHAKKSGRNRGVRINVKNTDIPKEKITEYMEDLNLAIKNNFLVIEKIIIGG